jgi:hypothetical protein
MQGQHSHGVGYYRCRFPQEYALANSLEHPRNVYLREEALIDPLDRWLLQALSPAHRDHTIAHLAELGERSVEVADVGLGVATNSGWVVIACVRALVEDTARGARSLSARPLSLRG